MTTELLAIDAQGAINAARIVAVAPADAAPVRRLLDLTPANQIVVLTGGRKRRSVVVLDSGHVVLTALSVKQLLQRLQDSRARSVCA